MRHNGRHADGFLSFQYPRLLMPAQLCLRAVCRQGVAVFCFLQDTTAQ
jgi:hypothetical protein